MIRTLFDSMTSRIFLILVGGTIISGALVMTLAEYERKDEVAQLRSRHAAERVEQVILTLEAAPAPSRPALAAIAEKAGIRVDLTHSSTVIGAPVVTEFSSALAHTFGSSRELTAFEREGEDCPVRVSELKPAGGARHCQTVFTRLKDGTPVRLDIAYRDGTAPLLRGAALINILAFLVGISALALVVAYIATKPLRKLAQAARDFGNNIEHQPLPEDQGSREVREASVAFNSMQASIRNHIQERTYMLAAIAHDLQTPLTRLRLRLENVADDDLRTRLVADLTATQTMVKEGLEFAQSVNAEEPLEPVDLDSLIEAICNDAVDAGCEVTFSGSGGRPVMACPHALRRCISNLLDNAIKYGKFAHVSVRRENSKAIVSIFDGGPGIPDDQLEAVFQPFKRLENSRSRSSGGTGLGLTIARIIAGKHRGSLKLKNMGTSDLGLVATLELPVL
ncbi:osmolarity sensor protein EnvZ [mine drainage metagenome]|uniref:histidine kinase n=1 Tax=mine drainage metagenome TaxID=410659 RepID=A0A1J5QE06_9ZZZZ